MPSDKHSKLAIRPFGENERAWRWIRTMGKKGFTRHRYGGSCKWVPMVRRSENGKSQPPPHRRGEKYFHKQVDKWWDQRPVLWYILERINAGGKTTILAAQAMKLYTARKDADELGSLFT